MYIHIHIKSLQLVIQTNIVLTAHLRIDCKMRAGMKTSLFLSHNTQYV